METNTIELAGIAQATHSTSTPPHNFDHFGLKFDLFTNNHTAAIQPTEIVFIDSAVEDYQTLVDNLTTPTEVIFIDSQQDGIVQITESLQQYEYIKFDAIHIVSHGDVGQLFLGNIKLDRDNLTGYEDVLRSWTDSMETNADVLLYGCNVGTDLAGAEFVQSLSEYTQADVLASTDLTGSQELGGDWDLEYAVGEIEAELAFDTEKLDRYSHVLNSIFGDRLDIIYGLDGNGNLTVIDNQSPNIGNVGAGARLDYVVIETLPDPLDNFGHDHFGNIINPDPFVNLVNTPNADNLDLTVPPVGSNVPFSFNFGEGNFIGESEKTYDFDLPIYNSFIYNFDASSLQFNPFNFDFNSISTRDNRITFFFDFGTFDFSSITSQPGLKFDLINHFDRDNWNNVVNFGDELSFDATSVEFVSNAIVFEYKPDSFSFDRGSFVDNANLFDYKGISTNNYSINQFNASDFRALEYAFEGDEVFDSKYYLSSNTIMPGMNPFTDYTERGNLLGSDPNSVFDNSYYNANNPDAATSRMTALEHYLDGGWRAGLPGDPNYDPEANVDFNPFFSSEDYFTIHDDVRVMSYDPNAKSPLEDLIDFGFVEGRIYNEALQADNVLKITTTITPDSDPSLISQTRENFENLGLTLEVDNGNFQVTGDRKIITSGTSVFSEDDPSKDLVTIIFGFLTAYTIKGLVINGDAIASGGIKEDDVLVETLRGTLSGYRFGTNTQSPANPDFSNDPISIDYGNAELEDILGRTLPFPGQTESQRFIEIFRPEAVDGVEDFTILPVESGIIIPRTTEFPQGDALLEDLLNGGIFVGGKDELPEGAYVLTADTTVKVIGTPDTPEELPQGIRLGELEGGGTIRFLNNKSTGIEGFFTPLNETREKPFSLKNFTGTGKFRNIIKRINTNAEKIQEAGITDPVLLRIEMKQFTAEELKSFIDDGPIKNFPQEGIFEKIYFDGSDGTVVVDLTGTFIR